jgi:hypothetical protein
MVHHATMELFAVSSMPQRSSFSAELQTVWDVALLFPNRFEWNESDYLVLATNQLVELADGCLKVRPMPTISHQFIV